MASCQRFQSACDVAFTCMNADFLFLLHINNLDNSLTTSTTLLPSYIALVKNNCYNIHSEKRRGEDCMSCKVGITTASEDWLCTSYSLPS